MSDDSDDNDGCIVAGAWVGLLFVLLAFGVWVWHYDVVHHCHGNGHYYWTTYCSTTGKTVFCYPVHEEETVCDR